MEAFVSQRLKSFLQQQVSGASAPLSNLDEIVLGYIVEVLSSLGDDDSSFDVDQFSEMIAAYVPEFAEVDSGVVCEWVFRLSSDLEQQRQRGLLVAEAHEHAQTIGTPSCRRTSVPEEHHKVLAEVDRKNSQECSHFSSPSTIPLTNQRDATTGREQSGPENGVQVKEEQQEDRSGLEECDPDHLTLLTEMFPEHPLEEICRTLLMCRGDLDTCTQTLLDRPLAPTTHIVSQEHRYMESHEGSSKKQSVSEIRGDEQLKDFVLSRYAFVDVDQDKVNHKPCMPKADPRKLTRYRDNQVVNTKGDRFTVPTKQQQEGEDMKKTYINLKPLRKYRFH